MTFEEVIEEHRLLTGSERVHVTLGPKATPENLREIFRQTREYQAEFDNFSKEEFQSAVIFRLKGYLHKCFDAVRKLDISDPAQLAVRNEVMEWSDMIPHQTPEDLHYMKDIRAGKRPSHFVKASELGRLAREAKTYENDYIDNK